MKTYKSFSSSPLPTCLSTTPPPRLTGIQPRSSGTITPGGDLSSIVPSLINYQILHRPSNPQNQTAVSFEDEDKGDLPPSYSFIDLFDELPSYDEAVQ